MNYADLALLGVGSYLAWQEMQEARESARLTDWLFLWEFVGWHFATYVPRNPPTVAQPEEQTP